MPSIKIRISAAVDADMGAQVFAPLVKAATKAKAQIEAILGSIKAPTLRQIRDGAGAGGSAGGYRTSGRTPEQQAAADVRVTERAEAAKTKAFAEAVRKRQALEKEAMREIDRDLSQRNRKKEKEDATEERRRQHIADAAALRVSGGAVRNFGAVVRRGAGVAADIARGAGVEFNLGGAVQRNVGRESIATDIANSGFMPGGSGANGVRQASSGIQSQAEQVALSTGVDATKALEGLQEFVSKTGDLQTGRDLLQGMAVLSQATGANLSDVASAAGDVSSNIADGADKAQRVEAVMRAIAGQGKLGAVEMRDFASQMAKIASAAPLFAGNAEQNIAMLGALAQESRQRGGSASATQAATSVQSFVNTFSKGARRKQFKAAGVDIEDSSGQLLSAKDIILNSLKATGGKKDAMGKLFADARARSVTRGFETIYNQNGGGDKGAAAVAKEFDRLTQAAMGQGEVAESFKNKLESSASQAQIFQTKLDLVAKGMQAQLLPALQTLAPVALKLATALASLVAWAAANPWKALMSAFGGSILKSLGSELMRSNTERLFGRFAGNMAVAGAVNTQPDPGAGRGGFMGSLQGGSRTGTALNALGAAFAITAAALTVYSTGTMVIDQAAKEYSKNSDKVRQTDLEAAQLDQKNFRADGTKAQTEYDAGVNAGAPTAEQFGALEKARQDIADKEADLQKRGQGWQDKSILGKAGAWAGALFNDATGGGPGRESLMQDIAAADQLKTINTTMEAVQKRLSTPLDVTVISMPPQPMGPPAPPSAVTPPGS